jgi:hypothetical protein
MDFYYFFGLFALDSTHMVRHSHHHLLKVHQEEPRKSIFLSLRGDLLELDSPTPPFLQEKPSFRLLESLSASRSS